MKKKIVATLATGALALGLVVTGGAAAFATGGAPSTQGGLPAPTHCYYNKAHHEEPHDGGYPFYYTWTGKTALYNIPGTHFLVTKYYYSVAEPVDLDGDMATRGTVYQYC